MEVYYLVVLFGMFWHGTDAIMWTLAPNTQKCLKEELHANVLVAGEYDVTEAPGQRVDYIVSYNKTLQPLSSLPQPHSRFTVNMKEMRNAVYKFYSTYAYFPAELVVQADR